MIPTESKLTAVSRTDRIARPVVLLVGVAVNFSQEPQPYHGVNNLATSDLFTANAKLAYYKGMDQKNTVLDDISAEIGYTATTVLVAWYGGTVLYIPRTVTEDHPLCKILGIQAFTRLVNAFSGDFRDVFIPKNSLFMRYERWRDIRKMTLAGEPLDSISESTGLTVPQVVNVRKALVEHGLLPSSTAQ